MRNMPAAVRAVLHQLPTSARMSPVQGRLHALVPSPLHGTLDRPSAGHHGRPSALSNVQARMEIS